MNGATRLFLDASVIIAAAHSPSGGSARILRLCELGQLTAVTSILVINEVERNLNQHFAAPDIERFGALLHSVPWRVVDVPSAALLTHCATLVHRDDAHVIAAALLGEVEFLITLDKAHFFTERLRTADLPYLVCTPGQFIQEHLPGHDSYPLPA